MANHLLLAKYYGTVDLMNLSEQGSFYDDADAVERAPKVGKKWASRWLAEHHNHIKKYKAHKLESQRAKALNLESVSHWFSLVQGIYASEVKKNENGAEGDDNSEDGGASKMDPGLLYGMDETCGWFDYAGQTMVLGGVGKKNQYSTCKQSRDSATLIVSTCADGTALRSMCIFGGKSVRADWVKSNPLDTL
jgi:hypothetical protein